MTSIKKEIDSKIESLEWSISYHLEMYEETIKETILLMKELEKYDEDKYNIKWLKASLDFIRGQKFLLSLANKRLKNE